MVFDWVLPAAGLYSSDKKENNSEIVINNNNNNNKIRKSYAQGLINT